MAMASVATVVAKVGFLGRVGLRSTDRAVAMAVAAAAADDDRRVNFVNFDDIEPQRLTGRRSC